MSFLRSLKDNCSGVVDLGVVLMVGITFAGLMVIAFIIYEIDSQLDATEGTETFYALRNITSGFDDAVNLLLIAITIFILAIAISALLMLRGR